MRVADASGTREHGVSATAAATRDLGQSSALPVEAVDALEHSVRALVESAERTLERLSRFRRETDLFLGLDADVDDRVVHRSGILIGKLSMLIRGLREAAGDRAAEPLSSQTRSTQSAGIRLFLIARRLDLLMEQQDRCGLRNLGILLSAIETLALERVDTPHRVEPPAPQLHYFFFQNHLPNVVPADGGRMNLVGSRLWRNGAPHIALVDRDNGSTTGPLEVQRTEVDHAVAVDLEPDWIAANAGRCLSLTLDDTVGSGGPGQPATTPTVGPSLPICIPLSFDTRYKIAGFLEYQSPTQTRRHKARSLLFENASCTEEKKVSGNLEWELKPGGWLTDMGESALYEAGATSIDCEILESRILCEGQLGPAVCGRDLLSGEAHALLLEQSEWEHIFTPVEEYPEPETHHSWAISGSVGLNQPPTELALRIPREEPSEATTIWYELISVNGGQQHTLFLSPRETLSGTQRRSYVVGEDRIAAEFDPAADAIAAVIDLTIEPADCRY
ncbi:MAG: hypothetical protein PVI91_12590 [Gammaproteobacteria bacterium]|jgi:hypothetical protein